MAAVYSETILEHYRRPHNRGSLIDPDLVNEEVNPLCGDRIRIELKLDAGRVHDARFRGDACAISVAASSILTDMVRGLSIAQAGAVSESALLGALHADIKPGRIQCALLPLHVLRGAVAGRPPA